MICVLRLDVGDGDPPHCCPHLSLHGRLVPPVGVVLAGTPWGPLVEPPGGGLVGPGVVLDVGLDRAGVDPA